MPDSVDLAAAVADVWLEPGEQLGAIGKLEAPEPPVTATELLLHGQHRCKDCRAAPLSAESIDALQQAIRRRRLAVLAPPAGSWRHSVLFTAPHTLELLRDGQPQHAREVYTGSLAKHFATAVGGACVTWTEPERERVGALEIPDASNRDPNHLTDIEMPHSVWFAALRALREQMVPIWGPVGGAMRPCLHVDVHGMRDPPAYSVDCLIGTSALRRHHGERRAEEFCAAIEAKLRPVLQRIPVGTDGGAMDLHAGGPATAAAELGGDWGAGSGRNTLTQMSTNSKLFAAGGSLCYTHAVQVELSQRLRKFLIKNEACRTAFAVAIVECVQGV